MLLHRLYPKEKLGIPFTTVPKTKVFVVKNGKFLEKVFLAKGEWEDSTNSTRLENLCYHVKVAQRRKLFRGLGTGSCSGVCYSD